MIKIVCLIQNNPSQVYFLNAINKKYKIALAVIESPVTRMNLLKKIRSKGILGSLEDIKNRLLYSAEKQKRNTDDLNKHFGNQWQSIDKSIPLLTTTDVNSKEVYDRLSDEKPDLILDHGTSMVKDHILSTASLALNLHWGLSPYYRGAYCTEWALVNWDPYNIGVTIHKLAKEIDGGDVLAQKRVIPTLADNIYSINMQLTKAGVELILQAIDHIQSGKNLHFKKQDFSQGFMTSIKQWDRNILKQAQKIESTGLLKAMLEKPARSQQLPIIEI